MSAETSSKPLSSEANQNLEEKSDEQQPTLETPDPMSRYLQHDPDHARSSLSIMNEMRLNNELFDVSLRVGECVMNAHRLVLASSSPYFYAMFKSDVAKNSGFEVELRDVKFDALQLLVEYLYSGQVTITDKNVYELLPASSFLQVNSVREACATFLTNMQLNPINCLGNWLFAEKYSCDALKTQSRRYALQNFGKVVETDDFLLLPFPVVKDLVSNDKLNVASEETVFMAVMDWVKHDRNGRLQYVAQLMEHVRMTHISKTFLVDVVGMEPIVLGESSCLKQYNDTVKYHMLPGQRSAVSGGSLIEKRRSQMPYIFAVGGDESDRTGESYNPVNDRWMLIAPMPHYKLMSGIASLGELVYAVGWRKEEFNPYLGKVFNERYDPNSNQWSAITPMGTPRFGLGLSAVHGLLYACGGLDRSWRILSSVERYDPQTGEWTFCPGMNTARHSLCVSVVDNCLYAVGGTINCFPGSVVERYDPRMSRWTNLPDMGTSRDSFAVAPVGDALYCAGGQVDDYGNLTSDVERFNVRRNAWEPVADMQTPKCGHAMVELDGELMVLGGYGNNGKLNSTERYDPRTDRWTMSTPMLSARGGFGAAVLHCRADMDAVLLADAEETRAAEEHEQPNTMCLIF